MAKIQRTAETYIMNQLLQHSAVVCILAFSGLCVAFAGERPIPMPPAEFEHTTDSPELQRLLDHVRGKYLAPGERPARWSIPAMPSELENRWEERMHRLESLRARLQADYGRSMGIVVLPLGSETISEEELGKFWLTTNSISTITSNDVPYRVLLVTTNYGSRPDFMKTPIMPSEERMAAARQFRQSIREEDQRVSGNQSVAERYAFLRERAPNLKEGMTVHEIVEMMGPPDQVLAYRPIEGVQNGFMLTPVMVEELGGDKGEAQMIFTPRPSFDPFFRKLGQVGYETLAVQFDKSGRTASWEWLD